jgi:hypothetical protein
MTGLSPQFLEHLFCVPLKLIDLQMIRSSQTTTETSSYQDSNATSASSHAGAGSTGRESAKGDFTINQKEEGAFLQAQTMSCSGGNGQAPSGPEGRGTGSFTINQKKGGLFFQAQAMSGVVLPSNDG